MNELHYGSDSGNVRWGFDLESYLCAAVELSHFFTSFPTFWLEFCCIRKPMAIFDMDAIKLFYLTLRIITPVDSVSEPVAVAITTPDTGNANSCFIDD